MKDKLIKTIATFFGVGYLPFMPGTWGSMAGVLIYFLARHNNHLFLGALITLFLLGAYSSGRAEKIFNKKDDKRIIIDELFGTLLLFFFLIPSRLSLIAGFILFRVFDIIKPYPIKKAQELSGSLGIMADDIIAAFYSYIVIFIYALLCNAFLSPLNLR